MKVLIMTIIALALTTLVSAGAKKDSSKKKIRLEGQLITIEKVIIVDNRMPGSRSRYIVFELKAKDGKKIKAKYSIERMSIPSLKYSVKVTERRGAGCIVRNLPTKAVGGLIIHLQLKDANGKTYLLRGKATLMTVH